MPPINDFRSDSPLHLICVGWVYLSAFEELNLSAVFRVVRIEKFWCHGDTSGFHGPRSVQNPSSQTRNCFRRNSSQWFSASIGLRSTDVSAVIKLSLEPTQRYSLSARSFTLAGGEPYCGSQCSCSTVSEVFSHSGPPCSYDIASKQPTERSSSSCTKVEEQ